MSRRKIRFKINGVEKTVEVEPNKTLLWLIREELKLKGTKKACERGDCGLCTVLLNGEPVKSCLVLAVEVDGS
ncbi:MAG: 2Fe-2S iron-sulfur cluster-binding protein, partial [Thaumarchaeota archaeon]|nr:2Fe-2S iron-sulfur cluster-binding protein [Candidatus Geocrenenecus arthurdayi]